MNLTEIRLLKNGRNENVSSRDYLLYYLISGQTVFRDDHKTHLLSKEDVIVFNPNERHSLEYDKGMIIAVRISYRRVLQLIGYQRRIILCNSAEKRSGNTEKLIRTIHSLIKAQNTESADRIVYEQNALQLVSILMTDFSSDHPQNGENERKIEIEEYLDAHYDEDLSLEMTADHFGLSSPYFSKFFHQVFQTTFLKYLNRLRVSYAAEQLSDSEEVILKIALNNGFNNTASFIREFKEVYGMTPSEYRQKNKLADSENETDLRKIAELLKQEEEDEVDKEVFVEVRADSLLPLLDPYWKRIINLGSFQTVLKNGVFEQIQQMRSMLNYKTARLKVDCFADRSSNYFVADRVMNFFVENHMDVILVLDLREAENSEKYLSDLSSLCSHYSKRFGDGIHHHTTFEIEFNSEYHSDNLKLYRSFYERIRAILDGLGYSSEIIGPSVLAESSGENFRRFVKANPQMKTYTICLAPYAFQLRNNEVLLQRVTDSDYVTGQYLCAKRVLEEENPNAELLISSWRDRLNDVDLLNDTEYAGARILQNALQGYGILSSLPIDAPLDLMFDETRYDRMFNSLPGIMTLSGIPKPSFYALRFLDRQDSFLASIGTNHLVSASSNQGFYQIVIHNCKKLGYRYYLNEGLMEDVEDIRDLFEDNNDLKFTFAFRNMAEGKYLLKTRIVSSKEGSPYAAFRGLKYSDDSYMGRDEENFVRSCAVPKMTGETVSVGKDGSLRFTIILKPNEFRHIHIVREKE